MTPAELLATAQTAKAHLGDGLPDCWLELVAAMSDCILATVHADDDEPAHRGFYKRLGFEVEGGFLRKRLADGATFTVYRSGWLGFNDCSLVKNPTCGQVRSLFKILNVEVK